MNGELGSGSGSGRALDLTTDFRKVLFCVHIPITHTRVWRVARA